MEDQGDPPQGLMDAQQFLRVSEALKGGFARLGAADLSPAARDRWQRRLLAITNLAKHDLDRAEQQMDGFLGDLDRELGQGPPPAT